MKKKINIFLLIMLVISYVGINISNAQTYNPFPIIIPPSPEASSLGKYADIPISLFTGTPQISIPIYTIRGHKHQLPISVCRPEKRLHKT